MLVGQKQWHRGVRSNIFYKQAVLYKGMPEYLPISVSVVRIRTCYQKFDHINVFHDFFLVPVLLPWWHQPEKHSEKH